MCKVWSWVRDHLVKAIILVALTGSITAYLKGVFDEIIGDVLPKGAEISCAGREWVADRWPFRQSQARDIFRILIATLAGDDASGTQTQAVVRAFQGQRAIDAILTCRILKIQGAGPMAEETAAKTGSEWLARRSADVLMFGEVLPKGEALNLQFLSSGRLHDFTAKSFSLESGLLKEDFKEAAAAQLQAVALAAARPTTEERGKYQVKNLRPVIDRLKRVAESPPPGMSASRMADVQFALGQALLQVGDNGALREAASAYREALKEYTRERVPLDWAKTQNNLGAALWQLGERESDPAKLEEAVLAYREALKENTRERVPLSWASTQNNLGAALTTLGERASDPAKLEEAVLAYREALKEYTGERVPLDWGMTQNNLGVALSKLGQRESGTGKLEEAVLAYREALKAYTRERVPVYWAATQMNLGGALLRLGERESGTGKLEEAVLAYREALKEYTRERVPLDWAQTQNNLGVALSKLGERESGTGKLEEAVLAYREALKEWTQEAASYSHNIAQQNLDGANTVLARRRGNK